MKSKGQWFILSAVIASATFLSLSILYKGYFSIDPSGIIRSDEDFLFLNILNELNNTINYSKGLPADEFERNIKEFISFAEQKAMKYGYFLEIKNETLLDIAGTLFRISLASYKMNITKVVEMP